MTQQFSKLKLISSLFFFPMRSFLARLGIRYDLAAITNGYYRKEFYRVPLAQRAVVLPHCLIDDKCPGRFSKEDGVICIKCKKCRCGEIRLLAEERGWQFYISPSSGFTKRLVKRKTIRAAVGVACDFEIEKGIRSTSINPQGVQLKTDKVIPQVVFASCYDCMKNNVDWEKLKKIILDEPANSA